MAVVGEPRRVERGADDADLAVHHAAGRHHVCAGTGLGDGDLRVHLERRVVVDRAVPVEDAAVTVVGVLVDAQIGHHHHAIADRLVQVCQGQLHNPLRIEGLRADGILGGRDPEENERADPEIGKVSGFGEKAGSRVLHHSRQRDDRIG